MDGVTIALEFESINKEEIIKDIYNPEKKSVDFNLLLPCPEELESTNSGSPESDIVKLMKKKNKTFDLSNNSLAKDVQDFIDTYPQDHIFLTKERIGNKEDFDSVVNTIKCYQKYGFGTWIDFKYHVWGVSRNAFNFGKKVRTKNGGFYFVTANGIPKLWLIALSNKWRGVEFIAYSKGVANKEGLVNIHCFLNGEYTYKGQIKKYL